MFYQKSCQHFLAIALLFSILNIQLQAQVTNEGFLVDTTGNIGVGTNSPSEHLDIVGDGVKTGINMTAYNSYVSRPIRSHYFSVES